MEEMDIKQLWQMYDQKLERTLQLNHSIIHEIQTQKAESSLISFRRNQVFGILAGILWISFLIYLVLHALNNIYFVISVGGIALFNILAVAAYIRHLGILERVNITQNIAATQKKLATVQASLNMVGRILVLQTPLYCTFWYNKYLVANGGTAFWLINLTILAFVTAISVYLFYTLTYKNMHKKWVKAFMESFGGKQLIKTMEFLKDLEAYQKEETA